MRTREQDLPRVKVCGLTHADDVALALEAGADALGFVVHLPSPRHVEPHHVADLLAQRSAPALAVLVLVEATPQQASEALELSGADAIQLCGEQSADQWRDFSVPIFRRVPVSEAGHSELHAWREVASAFVLDHPGSAGGSGCEVDLELAASLTRLAPCLLAGGLGPHNVARIIEAVTPHGVDASSKLESEPGRKSTALVQDFVRLARAALTPSTR